MGQSRFETIFHYLTFHDSTTSNESDRRPPVCTLVDAFNQHRLEKVHPSSCHVVDESVASWISRNPEDCACMERIPVQMESDTGALHKEYVLHVQYHCIQQTHV